MIKIRYHHFMCIPRFVGEGYNELFCANLQKIKDAINSENFEMVDGCDDVCKYCPNNVDGKCKDEEKVQRYDALVREAFEKRIAPQPKEICSDCRWFDICKNL